MYVDMGLLVGVYALHVGMCVSESSDFGGQILRGQWPHVTIIVNTINARQPGPSPSKVQYETQRFTVRSNAYSDTIQDRSLITQCYVLS